MNYSKQIGNFQDLLLNHVRKEEIQVTVYLVSGFQIKGLITGFDNYVLLIDSDGKTQMIYKHAISTVVPIKAVDLKFD